MMNVMSVKRKFTMNEVINLTENCYSVGSANWLRAQLEDYVTADDVVDLCDLREIGFENVRWVKDIFEEFGGCWIAEKCENERDESLCDSLCTKCKDGNKHGGMFAFGKPFERSSKMLVCLSVRV